MTTEVEPRASLARYLAGLFREPVDVVEFFQLVEKVDGRPYRTDLERLLTDDVGDLDVVRAVAPGRFLASVHTLKHADTALYHRRIGSSLATASA